ncbi:pentatricopeptide repeat-containing protein ELI1, chloroplastic [Macadamia integrifolia]|uniref:pentatricopeptide repeat-containing protein ELI1, chloroplastic n=1 Tax=Macadamia integrifolia TaxID=60698 RepID=UPI001C4EEF4B|nr:pentatricopeptide repeat-containing protein ELI1, chloroplastic [Macadamia integrifolia]
MSSTVHFLTTTHNPSLPFSPATAPRHLLRADRALFLIEKSKTINQLLQIHAALVRNGLEHHPMLNFKLLRSYSSLGRLDYSRVLFDRTHDPNVFFWTAIIHGHTVHGLHQQAFLLYSQMLTYGVEPNAFTFSSILKACSIEPGRALHSHALKFRFDSDAYVRTALLCVYARGGDVVSARRLFDTMPDKSLVSLTAMITCYAKHGDVDGARLLFDRLEVRDIVCWNVMIDGYTQHGRPNETLGLFRQMMSSNVKPDEVTILSVLSACGQLGALELGRWLHSYIKNNGIPFSVSVRSALVDMYCKCGSLEDAQLVFDRIINKDVVAWNTMIVGYSMHGLSQDALELFSRMCAMGIHPTDITFIGILSACSHGGLVLEGRAFFHSMKEKYGIEPRIEHYGCMVDLLGRAGLLDEAYELVQNMAIEPDSVIWGTLLGACRLHGNINLGENIAEFVIANGLANAGTYILLANTYAAAGNWNAVAKIRTAMKDIGVLKEPGCSSIEVHNKVHEFFAGDMKHLKSKQIYLMLEEMNGWLKAHGYTPQTDIVLQDIGEAEKEKIIAVHSEKLAIAFGLITTQPGTPIKIIKNVRVCTDCHTVTKLISKITGRKIIVRDRNRFHHFVDGSCSCGGYW